MTKMSDKLTDRMNNKIPFTQTEATHFWNGKHNRIDLVFLLRLILGLSLILTHTILVAHS